MSGYKWSERLLRTRAQVQTLMGSGGLNNPGFYIISNAVGATKVIRVDVLTVSTISASAINITDGTFGTYDITADTFVKESNTLQEVTDKSAGGTGVGVASTTHELDVMGMRVFGDSADETTVIGQDAAVGNTGITLTAVGASAANGNTGDDLAALGAGAGLDNEGDTVTAVGNLAANGNTGNSVTALGYSASSGNTFNNVIAIGDSAAPTADNQIAFNDGDGNPLTINLIPEQGSDMVWYLKVETPEGVAYVKLLGALP